MSEASAYARLKPRLRKFVDHIVRGNNGVTAARKIVPTSKRPDVLAAKWRAIPEVRAAIDERSEQAMEDAGVTNAQILLGIARIANLSVKEFVHADGTPKKVHELSDEAARAIQSIEVETSGAVKYRLPNRIEAAKLLGQYKRLFTETHEINLGEKTLEQLVAASWGKKADEPGPSG